MSAVTFVCLTAVVSPAAAGNAESVFFVVGATNDGDQERPSKVSSVASRR